MVELLNPNFIDMSHIFENEFQGLTIKSVSLRDLFQTRKVLVKNIQNNLSDNERKFILSIKKLEPNWSLLDIKGIESFPAIQWKMQNLEKYDISRNHKRN